jgi:hypothetical protein
MYPSWLTIDAEGHTRACIVARPRSPGERLPNPPAGYQFFEGTPIEKGGGWCYPTIRLYALLP